MGFDLYCIFHEAVKKCKTEKYGYDLDLFLKEIKEYAQQGHSFRIRNLAYSILKSINEADGDDSESALMDEVRYMLSDDGYENTDITIIKHGFNGINIRGELPKNCKMILTAEKDTEDEL